MFKWFLRNKKEKLEPLDFSILKTDIHSHLIPGIDDGPSDIENSVLLIKKLKKLGYSKLITTPHVMSDVYQNSPQIILNGLSELRKELSSQSIDIDISAAAEYYIDFNFEQRIGKEDFLTFGDNYILLEFSFSQQPTNIFEIIFKLQLEGYNIVLAHPERYGYYRLRDYKKFTDRGVLLQVNILSLIGYYSSQVQNIVEQLIKNNMVSFLGTDCHNEHHANLYNKCYTNKYWYELADSGKLLNNCL